MTTLRKTHDKNKYDFLNADCLKARGCFQPGVYQHRGATLSGSRNTGDESACCMRRAYHGCPDEVEHDDGLRKERKAIGWRVA